MRILTCGGKRKWKKHFGKSLVLPLSCDIGKVFLGDLEVTSCKRKEIRSVRGKVQLVMQNALGSLDPHQSVAAILEEPLQLLFL